MNDADKVEVAMLRRNLARTRVALLIMTVIALVGVAGHLPGTW